MLSTKHREISDIITEQTERNVKENQKLLQNTI